MAENGNKRAAAALKAAEQYEDALTAILVGNNVVNIGASSLATLLLTRYLGSSGAAVSTVAMTLLVLTFCEVLPKSYAKSRADRIALRCGKFLTVFTRLLTPFVWFFRLLSGTFSQKEEMPSVTEEELKFLIDEIEEEGVLEEQEGDLVISALRFDETHAGQILIPRVRITALEQDASPEEIQETILKSPYSRFPIYEKSLDHIIGMITAKDFFRLQCGVYDSLEQIVRDVLYIPETKRISEVLREMQKAKTHLAVVVDEHGGTQGLVTLEDILEELVGEIYDESDIVTPMLQKTAPHTYRVAGSEAMTDFFDDIDETDRPHTLPETDAVTVGGWVTEILERIPKKRETARWERFFFTVLETDAQRVAWLSVTVSSEEEETSSPRDK